MKATLHYQANGVVFDTETFEEIITVRPQPDLALRYFLRTCYHQPSDDLMLPIDYATAADLAVHARATTGLIDDFILAAAEPTFNGLIVAAQVPLRESFRLLRHVYRVPPVEHEARSVQVPGALPERIVGHGLGADAAEGQ